MNIDGLQNIIYDDLKDGCDSESEFYRTVSGIADLGCKGAFLIPCCTSTITGPIESFLKKSHQKHIYLPVASLHSPIIF